MTPVEIFNLLKERFGPEVVSFVEAKQAPAPKPTPPPAPAKPAAPAAGAAAAKPAVPAVPKPPVAAGDAAAKPAPAAAAPEAPKPAAEKPQAMAAKPEGEAPAVHAKPAESKPAVPAPAAIKVGDSIPVKMEARGETPTQGRGFLDANTMVIVEGGQPHLDSWITIKVTSVVPQGSGRTIYGDYAGPGVNPKLAVPPEPAKPVVALDTTKAVPAAPIGGTPAGASEGPKSPTADESKPAPAPAIAAPSADASKPAPAPATAAAPAVDAAKPATPPAAPKPAAAAPAAAGAAAAAKPAAPAAAAKPAAMVSIGDPFIKVTPTEKIGDVMAFLRDDLRTDFNLLHDLSGLDQKDCCEVVYHLNSLTRKHWIVVKVSVPRANGVCPTVSHLWKTAIWHEREAYDLFGMKFAGNPDLRRILLPDDWEGHPLLKDYKVQEFYRGMPVPYHGEHWEGEGTLVLKMDDIGAATLEQWFQMGLSPEPKPAEAAAAGAATATVAPPAAAAVATAPKPPAAPAAKPAETKPEAKPGDANPANPGEAPKPS